MPFEQIGQSAVKRLWRQKVDTRAIRIGGLLPRWPPWRRRSCPTCISAPSPAPISHAARRRWSGCSRSPTRPTGSCCSATLLELRERPATAVLDDVAPVLAALGEVTAGKPVVLVPGNHDHQLVAPALERERLAGAEPLEVAGEHPPRPGDLADRVAGLMPRTDLTVSYPGVWLRDDVYATHGHYLDAHLTVPRVECLIAAGVERFGTRLGPDGPADRGRLRGDPRADLRARARARPERPCPPRPTPQQPLAPRVDARDRRQRRTRRAAARRARRPCRHPGGRSARSTRSASARSAPSCRAPSCAARASWRWAQTVTRLGIERRPRPLRPHPPRRSAARRRRRLAAAERRPADEHRQLDERGRLRRQRRPVEPLLARPRRLARRQRAATARRGAQRRRRRGHSA